MKLKILAIAMTLVMLFGTLLASAEAVNNSYEIKKKIAVSKLFDNDEEEVIDASTPFDYGAKAGRQFKFLYKVLDRFTSFITKNKFNVKEYNDVISSIEKYCPSFLEELRGLSSITHIKLERLIALTQIIHSGSERSCTTLLATGSATKNDETFLIQDIDMNPRSISTILATIRRPIETLRPMVANINSFRYRYAFLGLPVIEEYPLINEMGMGMGGNGLSLTKNESRVIDSGPGISHYMLMRLTMMTCKNVSEVAELWKNTERASGESGKFPHQFDGSIIVWCDKDGGILTIEQTHNYIITVFGNSTDITGVPEGILWTANHHQWLDPMATGSVLSYENSASYMRAERAKELLIENYGNITIDLCKSFARDYKGGTDKNKRDSSDICRIPDKNYSSKTMFSWIIEPKSLTVYWTRGPPGWSRFIKCDLSKIFGK